MIILALGETLESIDEEQFKAEDRSAVFVATSKEAKEVMELAEMVYEGDINLQAVSFCRMEAQQECLAGSFCIPKLLDVLGSRYRILFFINQRHIVIIDDNDFSWRLIMRIRQNRTKQGETREHFIYNFIGQFMSRDVETLGRYEKLIMDMEEKAMDAQQNRNMQFLTVISTIFFPLTLITGWYGMNFENMPELEEGYPGVIMLSLVVIAGCIYIFKKKKIL